MESAGGRPKKGHEARTKQVRMDDDLADMVGWVVKAMETTTAQYLARLTRAVIEADYAKYLPTIRKLQELEAEMERRAKEIRTSAEQARPTEADPPAGQPVTPARKRRKE